MSTEFPGIFGLEITLLLLLLRRYNTVEVLEATNYEIY